MMNETSNNTVDPFPFVVNVGFAIFIPLVILTGMVMNLGTITAFWKLPVLRESPSELLILNLACADLLTTMTVLPLVSPLYITPMNWPFGEFGCATVVFFMNLSISGSLFALTTISIDRFLLVYMEYPTYIKTITRKRVYKIMVVGWIVALLTVIIELSLWEKAKTIDDTARNINFERVCLSPARRVTAFALSFFLSLFVFPVLLVCGLSVAFLYQLRRRLQKIRRSCSTISAGEKPSQNLTVITDDCPSTVSVKQMSEETVGSTKQLTSSSREKRIRNRYIKPGITLVGVVLWPFVCYHFVFM
ncbi:allatostatin-A receptor-like [Amphiura filiformis]|uniref:allatostatin-A receptor-like n=1 Tax=Amphiura filiformis TaxID=82378 RepID=UPI003B2248A6